jgi:anti-sigma regulatory factor (Ser/Thr protein kinase)
VAQDPPAIERSFDCLKASARRVREFVCGALVHWRIAGAADDVLLIADELATNAVLHARSPFVVRLKVDGVHLRLEVEDDSQQAPQLGDSDGSSTSGRGLVLVDALATRWGWEGRRQGKLVWAEIATSA